MSSLTVTPEAAETVLFGTPVSNIQTGLNVTDSAITGTLKYLNTGAIATDWGAGNFMALKFTNIDSDATSVKVGLEPSAGSGLVELINDPDKNGVFKVTDKNTQKFVVVSTVNGFMHKQSYDLSGLTLQTS